MTTSAKPKFDAATAITNELIAIIARGVLPWQKPWIAGQSNQPLRHNGEPYQGVNNFLLTMRTMLEGFTSPYWMTMPQANALDARIRKGSKSAIVVYYGTTQQDTDDPKDHTPDSENDPKTIPFMKSYRVFNADQIDGLDDAFHPKPKDPQLHPAHAPIAHLQTFFDAIGGNVSFTGREAYYAPPIDKIYMPDIALFRKPEDFYSVWGHEYSHWTKARHRLNRDYGHARFGNTAYAREEITAELSSVFLGQHLGYAPRQIEISAAYLDNWLRVLRADKRAIFRHAADAQKACAYLIEASNAGQNRSRSIAA